MIRYLIKVTAIANENNEVFSRGTTQIIYYGKDEEIVWIDVKADNITDLPLSQPLSDYSLYKNGFMKIKEARTESNTINLHSLKGWDKNIEIVAFVLPDLF